MERGSLKRGDYLVAGTSYCRVKSLRDEQGAELAEVTPGMHAEVLGWKNEIPSAGETALQVPTEVV